jgi:hypothetical protein
MENRIFFMGELQQFQKFADTPIKPTRKGKKQLQRLNVVATLEAIGEVVTQHMPVLEEISGFLRSTSLLTWTTRLPRLQTMSLWRGDALENGVEKVISEHCPIFRSLSIYEW